MRRHSLPSQLKGLSLAVAQAVIVTGGMTQQASALGGCTIAEPGTPLTISTGVNNDVPVCQYDPGSVTVTLNTNTTLDASGYGNAINIYQGDVTLEDGAAIVVNESAYGAEGIYASDWSGEADVGQSVTLNAGSSVTAKVESTGEWADAAGIEVESEADFYNATNTITLNNGSSVNAEASAKYNASSSAIESEAYSFEGNASSSISANGASINASSTSTYTNSWGTSYAVAITSSAETEYAQTTSSVVELNNSSVSSSSIGYGSQNSLAYGIRSYAEGYDADETSSSVTLNTSTLTVTADSALGFAYANGIYAGSDNYGWDAGDAQTTVSLDNSSVEVSSAGGEAAVATGIYAYSGGKYGSTLTIDLSGESSVIVDAVGGYWASATGIAAESESKYDSSTLTLTLSLADSSLTVGAAAYYANATGIYAYSDSDYDSSSLTIDLSNSSVAVKAEGEYEAYAEGIYATSDSEYESATLTLNLAKSSLTVEATASDTYSSEAYATGIYADSESWDGSATLTLNMADSSLTVSASASYAEAAGIYAEASGEVSSSLTIDLSNSSVTVDTLANKYAISSGVSGEASGYGDTSATLLMDGGSISANASIIDDEMAYGSRFSFANAISLSSNSWEVESTASTTVSLENATVSSTSNNDAYQGFAFSLGMDATSSNGSSYGGSAEVNVTLNNTQLISSANASTDQPSFAYSNGLMFGDRANAGESSSQITLNNGASIEATAEASYSGRAVAMNGAKYGSQGTTISLDNASLTASASASMELEGPGKYTSAAGIFASNVDLTIDLNNANIDASASATGDYGYAMAQGIFVYGESASGDNAVISLSNSAITASVSGNGFSVGISDSSFYVTPTDEAGIEAFINGLNPDELSDYAFGDTYGNSLSVTLDSASSIAADYAVVSLFSGSSLDNAGTIDGTIVIETLDNSGTINGLTVAAELDNTGTINGQVIATNLTNAGLLNSAILATDITNSGTIQGQVFVTSMLDTSGSVFGTVGGNSLVVRDGGVVAGTADMGSLLVEAGGELQAILTDATDPTLAHFTAVDATLESGAKVHINGTSDLFNPDLAGVDYLILEADNSLTANTDDLMLYHSGLIGVDWAECSDLQLCVTVRALNLEEVAINDGADTNGVGAAAAAQSVLVAQSGTETGDAFFELLDSVVEGKAWNQLNTSGQGETVYAGRDAERVVSRYVQRLLQQGRNSGEEFQGGHGLWVQALQTDGEGDRQNGIAGFDIDTTGMALGYDIELMPGLFIGGVISTADSQVDADNGGSGVDTDTTMLSLYTQWSQNQWFANAVATYGRSDNDGFRYIVDDRAEADYDSDMLSVRLQAGKAFAISQNGWSIAPRAEFAYSKIDIDSYVERGSVAALSVGSQSYETLELGLGAELSKAFIIDRAVLKPYLDLAVYHDFASDQVQTSSRFVVGGDNFVTTGYDVEDTNLSATLGLSYGFGSDHTLKAAYEYFGNSDYNSGSWMLRYSYSF